MFKISPLKDVNEQAFKTLFSQYYEELGCEENLEHLLSEYILPDLKAGLIRVDFLEEDGPAGFVIYQTDGIENDWNFKEGWGDLREIYVTPEKRGQTLGRFLALTAEMRLKESGVKLCYCLPAEGTEKFFEACGYKKTDEYCEELDSYVYIKDISKPACKG